MEHLAKRTMPIQLRSLQNSINLCFSSYNILNFTRNFKLIFSQLLFLLNFASHGPTRTASLFFYPGFVLVIYGHFHLSFTLISFVAFYLKDKLCSLLLNKQAVLCLAFCSTLNPPWDDIIAQVTNVGQVGFHIYRGFSGRRNVSIDIHSVCI
jgi:hypothetical protein